MNRTLWLLFVLALAPLTFGDDPATLPPRNDLHRSPIDLALLPGGRLALTANQTSDSASLIDLLDGRALVEQPCQRKPAGVACSRDGRRAAVSNLWSGSVTLLEIRERAVQLVAHVPVGSQPRGLVFAADGQSLYVALGGSHEVIQLEWTTRQVTQRWPAEKEPRRLVLTPDSRFLAAACGRSGEVRCWDTQTGKPLWDRHIYDAFNLHGLTVSRDGQELIAAYVHHRHNSLTKHNIDHGWALNSRLARLPLTPQPDVEYRQIALDIHGKAVGDPCAVAFNAKGDWLVVAAGGTHELLCFHAPGVMWSPGDAGDFMDIDFGPDGRRFQRVQLGGRPVAVSFLNENQAVVANYLLDAVQLVDVESGKIIRQIPLGGPAQPSLARQGEAIFYDARRSHHQWFSCHTCHTDGHTNGRLFDTLNDESYGNSKLTPTLRGVSRTGPYTWHGWQNELGDAVAKSFTETMFGPKPSPEEVKAVVAYLETLEHPPNPCPPSAAAARGQALFCGKARCDRCHGGALLMTPRNYDLKLGDDGSPFELWNPPSLRGLIDRGPYLHDGRADALDELLRNQHAPEKLGGEKLTPKERGDLIEFLKRL
jgi:cytochrome c peroxidase